MNHRRLTGICRFIISETAIQGLRRRNERSLALAWLNGWEREGLEWLTERLERLNLTTCAVQGFLKFKFTNNSFIYDNELLCLTGLIERAGDGFPFSSMVKKALGM